MAARKSAKAAAKNVTRGIRPATAAARQAYQKAVDTLLPGLADADKKSKPGP